MALDTYDGLQDAVKSWLNREDSEVLDRIPDFIRLGEHRIFRQLRVPLMERVAVYSADDFNNRETIELPNDFLEIKNLVFDGRQLERKSDQFYLTRDTNTAAGKPRYFSRIGAFFFLWPTADENADVEMHYYFETFLSDDNITTALLEQAPGLYLFSALLEAEPFLKFPEMIPVWQAKYDDIFASWMDHAWEAEYAGSTVSVSGAYEDRRRGRGVFGL